MCAVCLEEPSVGRVVVCERQRGQGLPEALGQSQILRSRVLELGQLHFILQDQKSVGLDDRYEKIKPFPLRGWIETFNQSSDQG